MTTSKMEGTKKSEDHLKNGDDIKNEDDIKNGYAEVCVKKNNKQICEKGKGRKYFIHLCSCYDNS